jgi:hypothetical protein
VRGKILHRKAATPFYITSMRKMVAGRREQHSESNTVRMIKLRNMRWTWYPARMAERQTTYRILGKKAEGKRSL